MSLLEYFLPIGLLVKLAIIVALALITVFAAYFIPKGKAVVVIVGIVSCLIVWYVDLGIE